MFVFIAQILALIIIVLVALSLRKRNKPADPKDLKDVMYTQLKTPSLCHVCGYDNPKEALFCSNCGAVLLKNQEYK